MTNYKEDKHINPQVREFLVKVNEGTPLNELGPEKARQSLIDLQNSYEVDLSGIAEQEVEIDGISCVIVKPHDLDELKASPGFVFIHGGGWIIGGYEDHKRMVRDLVVESQLPCMFINYSLSPESKFPIALSQITTVVDELRTNGEKYGFDSTRIAIVGNSAGGNMTASVTAFTLSHDYGEPLPKIRCSVMMWPVTGRPDQTESWKLYGQDRYLTADAMKWFWEGYITGSVTYSNYYVIPNEMPEMILSRFPPSLVCVAENDILRDEGEHFGRLLDNAGVDVSCKRFNGMIHDWGLLNGIAYTEQAKELFRNSAIFLQKYLLV